MKYSDNNKPIECMMTNSTCYKGTSKMEIKGVLWHSTGSNNPWLKRNVQPSDNDPNYKELINLIGKNKYNNDWNHINIQAGLNAWIGKLADGSVAAVQTMPWDFRPWGCGSGSKGSCNHGWIQFEIMEDNLKDPIYFEQIYTEACELTAYLCKKFNIDPNGTAELNGVIVPTILCHKDSYDLKLGSNHGDVLHWFPKYGKDMNSVRADVTQLIDEEEDEEMTQEKFNEMMNVYLQQLAKQPVTWEKDACDWAVANGLLKGDATGNLMPKKFMTRGEFATVLQRFSEKGL